MRVLKSCHIVMNCAYWTKIGIKNLGKKFTVESKHELNKLHVMWRVTR